MQLNLFAITSLLVTTCSLALAIFVFITAKTRLHKIWGWFNLSVFAWAIGTFFAATSRSPLHAALSWKWAYGLGATVPFLFYLFNYEFCQLKTTKILKVILIVGIMFAPINLFSPLFINELAYLFNSFYYNKATPLFSVFMFYLLAVVLFSFKELMSYYKKSTGNKHIQASYLLWGFGIGWSGGIITFLPAYNILIYPSWNLLVCIYTLLMTYAIYKHRLMDIKIVLRIGAIYSMLVFIIAILYLLTVFASEKIIQSLLGYHSMLISILSAFGLGILFFPLRNKIQNFVNVKIFTQPQHKTFEENQFLKKEVADKERFKIVSTLSSSIAHDIKSPLTAIKTYFEYFPQKKNDPQFLEDFQRIVGSEISRINDLTNNLLEFAKPSPLQLQTTNITALLEKSLTLLHHQLVQNNINVVKQLDSTDSIQADPNKLTQAFLNLILNAIEAMPNGGTLTIFTKSIDEQVVIGIKDTGQGINKEVLKQIFVPFCTTKTKGTGLGLYIIKNIFDEHTAKIKIDSIPNQGTEIKITFNLKGRKHEST